MTLADHLKALVIAGDLEGARVASGTIARLLDANVAKPGALTEALPHQPIE